MDHGITCTALAFFCNIPTLYGNIWCSMTLNKTLLTLQHSLKLNYRYFMAFHDTARHSMTLHDTSRHSMTLHDTPWHSMTLHDTFWYDLSMILNDTFWHSMTLPAIVEKVIAPSQKHYVKKIYINSRNTYCSMSIDGWIHICFLYGHCSAGQLGRYIRISKWDIGFSCVPCFLNMVPKVT